MLLISILVLKWHVQYEYVLRQVMKQCIKFYTIQKPKRLSLSHSFCSSLLSFLCSSLFSSFHLFPKGSRTLSIPKCLYQKPRVGMLNKCPLHYSSVREYSPADPFKFFARVYSLVISVPNPLRYILANS